MGAFETLEEFFLAGERTVDGRLDDGWASVPVIGREIEGAVLVARMEGFLRRSAGLDPVETLALANKFLSHIAAEGLRDRGAVIEHCAGGELRALFARGLGSEDPFGEAIDTARWMCQLDTSFAPRIGVAAGALIVGYLGPPLHYSCSLIGRAVAEAERCAALEPQLRRPGTYAAAIGFPQASWGGRRFEDAFAPYRWRAPNGRIEEWRYPWEPSPPREVELGGSETLVACGAVAQVPELGGERPELEVGAALQRLRRAGG